MNHKLKLMNLLPVVAMSCFINTSLAYAANQSLSTTVSKLANSSMSHSLAEESPADKCDSLKGRLMKLQSYNRNVLQNMIDSAQNTAFVLQDWYDTYSQDYGQTVYVPYGNYENIKQSAFRQRRNVQVFINDASRVNDQLMAIIVDLASCKISTP